MESQIEVLPSGSVTSPRGFKAGATYAGIKKAKDSLDLGILVSEAPCTAAAVFTTNRVKAAPVILSQERLKSGGLSAVVVNSGCANACTGQRGLADADEMTTLAANKVGVPEAQVAVASTGVIGQYLPMMKIKDGIKRITLSGNGGHDLEKAMMTTDTVPKEIAVNVAGQFTIGGAAKGAGMIHPNLATLLCFLTTDAGVEKGFLRAALKKAVDLSFNMVSIDEDTSTNDTVLIMANGLAGNRLISRGTAEAEGFQQALNHVCISLAKDIARDGEGATRLIEVTITGAPSVAEARLAARTVIASPLVKTAVHGNDPNWGRIMAAVGRSGVDVVEAKVSLDISGIPVLQKGSPLPFSRDELSERLKGGEVRIRVDLGLGRAPATAWGCDLSEEYVIINSQYTT